MPHLNDKLFYLSGFRNFLRLIQIKKIGRTLITHTTQKVQRAILDQEHR